MFNLKAFARLAIIVCFTVAPINANDVKSRTHTEDFVFVKYTLYDEAKKYLGLNEKTNTRVIQNLTDVNPRRTPWCAAFINGILRNQGHTPNNSNVAYHFRKYGIGVTTPKEGDIVVFKNHVGIFVKFVKKNGKTYVAVLGGNQSNEVKISYFRESRVVAYRRPG